MSGLFGSTSTTLGSNNSNNNNAASNSTGDISKDIALTSPPDDSISSIKFSPQSEHLAVASWDKKVRIYEINNQGQSEGKAFFEHEGPVLDVAWSPDGKQVFGVGADKAARVIDLVSLEQRQVAVHDAPIRCCQVVEVPGSQGPILVTGSWDKKVKYWDLRQSSPVATIDCQDRVYAMDSRNKLLVVGTADRYLNIIDLSQPQKFYKTVQSPLKWQTRCVSTFIDATGFAIGSTEGRCAIHYVEDKEQPNNFSFKCHRQTPQNNRDISNVYSVNAISFHPEHGTFSTAGSDGAFHFWDKDAKNRLKGYPEVGGPIVSTDFNRTGNIFAYAVSYDWSKGFQSNTQQQTTKIMLHAVAPDEAKPRPKNPAKR
ncbi:MAG: RNA export factor gle2 [Gomphillus americanus]|uniref:RNA export factor gle2 n=1 Tax=Gomphillus americanus TaxID=1940652 RepID=A0A8H3FDM4_9LECA|nr:MAG: RNA export factor gle2 [Gomphillus americanus]